MQLINPENYPSVRALFKELEVSHALVEALFDGNLQAKIFTERGSNPQTGMIVYKSRVLICGNASLPGFDERLKQLFTETLIPAHKAAGQDAFLFCFSDPAWKAVLENAFSEYTLYHGERQYYETTDFQSTPGLPLPDGFSLRLITPEFMASDIAGLDQIHEEMCSERTSIEDFLAHSFGLCPVYENEIAGWCMSEYNTGSRCEIGIATAEKHQRKGIATLAAKAFLAESHRRGITRVGWDCWKRNIASAASARKAGLALVEEYPAVVIVLSAKE